MSTSCVARGSPYTLLATEPVSMNGMPDRSSSPMTRPNGSTRDTTEPWGGERSGLGCLDTGPGLTDHVGTQPESLRRHEHLFVGVVGMAQANAGLRQLPDDPGQLEDELDPFTDRHLSEAGLAYRPSVGGCVSRAHERETNRSRPVVRSPGGEGISAGSIEPTRLDHLAAVVVLGRPAEERLSETGHIGTDPFVVALVHLDLVDLGADDHR